MPPLCSVLLSHVSQLGYRAVNSDRKIEGGNFLSDVFQHNDCSMELLTRPDADPSYQFVPQV